MPFDLRTEIAFFLCYVTWVTRVTWVSVFFAELLALFRPVVQPMSGSGSYASRLKKYPAKGVCGLPEMYDSKEKLEIKLITLIKWWQEASRVVVLTGAGISTSAGISDFRGPKGVWTLELEREKEQKRKRSRSKQRGFGKRRKKSAKLSAAATTTTTLSTSSTTSTPSPTTMFPATNTNNVVSSFESAQPTLTHRAITALVEQDKISYVVTQNVDGLHQRAKLPRGKLAILHGCVFEEMCEKCGALYFRDKEVNTISFQPTGNVCEKQECGGACRDTLLDWEDPLPENQLCPSEEECKAADLIVTLGTSLRIEPAASLPLLCKEEEQGEPRRKSAHRRIVIINLQETPKDSASDMLLRAKVDMVMERVCTSMFGEDWDSV